MFLACCVFTVIGMATHWSTDAHRTIFGLRKSIIGTRRVKDSSSHYRFTDFQRDILESLRGMSREDNLPLLGMWYRGSKGRDQGSEG